MGNIHAYLDDFSKVTVYVNNAYYQGRSDVFYLYDSNNRQIKLTIESSTQLKRDICYRLSISEDLLISEDYTLYEQHGDSCVLGFRYVVKTKKFDQLYYYDKDDLGANYTKEQTEFVVWAPTARLVTLRIEKNNTRESLEMIKEDRGVFRLKVKGDYSGALYTYLINVNGGWTESIDPYGKSCNANSVKSAVVDFSLDTINKNRNYLNSFSTYTKAIIYEASIRDYTYYLSEQEHLKGKMGGLFSKLKGSHDYTVCDYLRYLGITHLQLMPVFDYKTVNELDLKVFYNWGYDPVSHMMVDGSISENPSDPMSRIKEFKTLVSNFHKAGIRVNMDVVFNHVFNVEESAFQKCVPYYYFRYQNERLSNGSYCGNDFDSMSLMARKYIVDSCVMWVKEYDVDGFRFDLMGILDIDTVKKIESTLRAIKPDIMLYGEGWNMPTALDDAIKATMFNQHQFKNIAFFNDFYRDTLKGSTSYDRLSEKGYLTGNTSMIYDMQAALCANVLPTSARCMFDSPKKSINFVACHDNHTLWDKLSHCCSEESDDQKMRRQMLINGAILVSQGVSFIHGGQEFCRSKDGVGNSYASSDEINAIEFLSISTNNEVVDYTKKMIQFRKDNPYLRFETKEEIEKHVSFYVIEDKVLVYCFKDLKQYEEVLIFFNPTNESIIYSLNSKYDLIVSEKGPIDAVEVREIILRPISMMIVRK